MPLPGAAESEHGQCSRPPRTGRSGSFGRPTATTGRRASRETVAAVGSDRADGHLRVGSETGACWSVRLGTGRPAAGRVVRRSDRARSAPPGDGRVAHLRVRYGFHLRVHFGARGEGICNGAVVEEPKELGPPQLDSARSVPIGARTDGSGNRVSVKRCHGFEAGRPVSSPTRGIARHAERRDGRCEQVETKANARHSTSGGPCPFEQPRKVRRREPAAPTGALSFSRTPLAPPGVGSRPPPSRHPCPPHRKMCATSAAAGRSAHSSGCRRARPGSGRTPVARAGESAQISEARLSDEGRRRGG